MQTVPRNIYFLLLLLFSFNMHYKTQLVSTTDMDTKTENSCYLPKRGRYLGLEELRGTLCRIREMFK